MPRFIAMGAVSPLPVDLDPFDAFGWDMPPKQSGSTLYLRSDVVITSYREIAVTIRSINEIEDTCCRCIRRAWEVPAHQCNAAFDQDGSMLKCDNCSTSKKDCVSVVLPMRRGLDEAHPMFRSRRRLQQI